MKNFLILALLTIIASSCSNNNDSTSGIVSLKATAVSTTGNTSITARSSAGRSTVVITDFKINIGKIKFETDIEDVQHSSDPSHEDAKLNGPFLLDLLDENTPLSKLITSVEIPDAKYEEIKFMFEKSLVAGDMFGKTFFIKGTINGKEFVIWSDEDVKVSMDFTDSSKDFTVNGGNSVLNIKMQLDGLMLRLTTLANQGLLIDTDGDGIIEISTNDDDGHNIFGSEIKDLLENETHLDDEDY